MKKARLILKSNINMIFVILFTALSIQASGQQDDYYDEGFIRNQDFIYDPAIKTVLLYRYNDPLSPPVIRLNSPEKLVLVFDDFEGGITNYRYTVIHCDAFWNESQIQQIEYLDGFYEDDINDYQFSFNTIQPYTNYMLTFPTDYMRLKKSGNYLLKVFIGQNTEENVVFTRRFMVTEPLVNVQAEVVKTLRLDDRYTRQQVDFKVLHPHYPMPEPYTNVHVMVRQNDRWDNAISNIKPRMVLPSELDYTQIDKLSFEAGNEFRYLDMKTVKYNTDRMQGLDYRDDGYHVFIYPDLPRASQSYITNDDLNGNYLVAVNERNDAYTEAEYAWVYFLLPYRAPLEEGTLYVMGRITNWQFSDENKLNYNYDLNAYEAVLYLKQGYFNYNYAYLPDGSDQARFSLVEGSHWEAENEYSIYVYHRERGEFYDRLVGVHYVNSVRQ